MDLILFLLVIYAIFHYCVRTPEQRAEADARRKEMSAKANRAVGKGLFKGLVWLIKR